MASTTSHIQPPPSALQHRSSRLSHHDRSHAGGVLHPSPMSMTMEGQGLTPEEAASSSSGPHQSGAAMPSHPATAPDSRPPPESSSRASASANGGSTARSSPSSSLTRAAINGGSTSSPDKSSMGQRKKKNKRPPPQNKTEAVSRALGIQTRRDIRSRLPPFLRRFTGWREPGSKPPFEPLPFPPFTWLKKIPMQYEVWLLSFIGAFVGIVLIEATIGGSFQNDGTILVVASFGATAVLQFATIESPLGQPRHAVGGQIVSAIVAVALNRLFRKSSHYDPHNTVQSGELHNLVWIDGALAMAVSLLAMQITGTVHPPGGATAIIASTIPSAIEMSWRFVYIVIISSVVMTAWALIINNVGRRRYPSYWLSGSRTFVIQESLDDDDDEQRDVEKGRVHRQPETQDQAEMEVVEGRAPWPFSANPPPNGSVNHSHATAGSALPQAGDAVTPTPQELQARGAAALGGDDHGITRRDAR